MMEEELTALLVQSAEIQSYVNNRITWADGIQGAGFPRIVLNRIDLIQSYNYDGPSGHSVSRIQVSCYDIEASRSLFLSRVVSSLLSGYKGGKIQAIFLDSKRDSVESPPNSSEKVYGQIIDLLVHYGEDE